MIDRLRVKTTACMFAMLLMNTRAVRAETAENFASHIADSNNPALVHAGMLQYKTYCAQCHGRNLQGQPLWQLQDADHHRRAPAHDDNGHTWQHSDEELFQMIKLGRFPSTPASAVSYMPRFGPNMRDQQILEVVAFIKSRWATGIRISQASLNPGFAGMPTDSEGVSWTLPPSCNSSALQDWSKGPR